MAEYSPIPVNSIPEARSDGLALSDFSVVPKWRVFSGFDDVIPGTSRALEGKLIWSVSPGEWTVVGERPDQEAVVELTHVRVMFRLTGTRAQELMSRLCALDLGNEMFPNGAAARTLVAGVATELVRDDQDGDLSILVMPSRSFGRYLHDALLDAGQELGLV